MLPRPGREAQGRQAGHEVLLSARDNATHLQVSESPSRLDPPARETSSCHPGSQEATHVREAAGLRGSREGSHTECRHLAAPWMTR